MNERWLPVVGYEGFYEVSDMGRVKSLSRRVKSPVGSKVIRERFLKLSFKGVKYQSVTLFKLGKSECRTIHTMVLRAFAGGPNPGEEGCHRNNDCQDNRLTNLRWDTRQGNRADSIRDGIIPFGQKHWNSKLNAENVCAIRSRVRRGEDRKIIARDFGIKHRTVGKIVRRETWAHIPDPDPDYADHREEEAA
ncbi:MAG: NUMOD4 domain-containing protein [Terriglobia bacterium]|nr:NUMOD4 domain-containing protein [Terriglobia bacterium]